MEPRVYLAFRFHVNFYHSYRGDTPSEVGFGKDIRIIRHLISVLDEFNAQGIPVRGTWDIENAFSLGDIMPEHCPDLIQGLQRRVRSGQDEIEIMSYNNGLISAHTAAEFDAAISRAFTNDEGAGLADIFEVVRPIVRPQEMMFTPLHIKLYRNHGLDAVSLFYSAVPFNAFSNFIAPLSLVERYNPLTLTTPGLDESLTLLPAYNHGDIADHLSLRRWAKSLRRQQLEMDTPRDLLILIDADADDEYWCGYDWPIVRRLLTATQGLEGLVNSVADLDFLTFTTPYDYLQSHESAGEVRIGQDTGDGSFDGLTSWAEKWSNHRLWTGIERSRTLAQQTQHLVGDTPAPAIQAHLDAAFEARLRALSTTHFGLAAPVMNRSRLQSAADLVSTAFAEAYAAFEMAAATETLPTHPGIEGVSFAVVDYTRGTSTDTLTYTTKPSRGLVRLPMTSGPDKTEPDLVDDANRKIPAVIRTPLGAEDDRRELCFVVEMNPGQTRTYHLRWTRGQATPQPKTQVTLQTQPMELSNTGIRLAFDERGNPINLTAHGVMVESSPLMRTAVRYDGRLYEARSWHVEKTECLGQGAFGAITMAGEIALPNADRPIVVKREYVMAAELPYLYVTTDIDYPATPSHTRRRDLVHRLEREFDDRWEEIMPCEIKPGFADSPGRPLRIWKHNYLDHVSTYDLDYADVSNNAEVDASNNQITDGWVAISDQNQGVLIAQGGDATTCFAFCPMRTRRPDGHTHVHLNPFGTYFGRQMSYPSAQTGLGKRIAILMTETLCSMAPSYSGHQERFALMLAPYQGDAPQAAVQADAEAFAHPYAILTSSPAILPPEHRTWSVDRTWSTDSASSTD